MTKFHLEDLVCSCFEISRSYTGHSGKLCRTDMN
jgi:hypothetical protein